MEIAQLLIRLLSKKRKVLLCISGRTKLSVTPMRILGKKVRVEKRTAAGKVDLLLVTMADITAVKDPNSGERIWPREGESI